MAANSTITVVFDNRGQAESAIDELHHAGFAHDQVGIVTPAGRVKEAETPIDETEETAAEGAVEGAVSGGAIGAVAGALVSGLIPGVGPVLAGGLLTGIILGGAAGAAAGSYLGPFIAMGLSEDDARRYSSELKEGRTVVMVKAPERRAEAISILYSHGGHNGYTPSHAGTMRTP